MNPKPKLVFPQGHLCRRDDTVDGFEKLHRGNNWLGHALLFDYGAQSVEVTQQLVGGHLILKWGIPSVKSGFPRGELLQDPSRRAGSCDHRLEAVPLAN